MRYISVKLIFIQTSGSGADVILRYFLSRGLVAILFHGVQPFGQF